eukprot:scaffold5066_cov403-Prasinococcus_capsulatus_cf.AAC.9
MAFVIISAPAGDSIACVPGNGSRTQSLRVQSINCCCACKAFLHRGRACRQTYPAMRSFPSHSLMPKKFGCCASSIINSGAMS